MAENFDDAIKEAKAYKESLDAISKSIENQTNRVGALANEMGIAFGAWNSQTKKTQEDRLKEIKLINDATKSVQAQKSAISEAVTDALNLDEVFKESKTSAEIFSNALRDLGAQDLSSQYSNIYELQDKITQLEKEKGSLSEKQIDELEKFKKINKKYIEESTDFNKENESYFKKQIADNEDIQEILNDLPLDSISDKMEFIKKLREGEVGAVEKMLATDKLNESSKEKLLTLTDKLSKSQEHLSDLQAESAKQMKTQTNLLNKLINVAKANSENAFKSIYESMKLNNQAFKDAQRDFGLMFGQDGASYTDMAMLTSKAAEFNMSTKDTLEMMGQLGEELRTIDTQYLASTTEHFVAIQKAVGISSKEITAIAGEMMRAGRSAEDVENFMEGSNKMAQLFGVNSRKVLQGVAANIDRMRQMGFTSGEASLTRMVATAERLRMNVDEIFDVAKRARTIEGAMDMAAELQLAGGSFAAINPMDLLAAARKGPEELQKILTQMGGDIGSWNKETGEFQFDPVDVDRLQIVADATGQSLDSIQKMIQKNAEDARKEQFMPDLALGEVMGPDGKPLDQDMMTNMLKDSLDIDGTIAEGSILDKAGIKDISELTSEQAQSIMQDHINKQASLEEQAKQNQSFQDSINAFKEAVMNLFTVFQPLLDVFTSLVQGLNSFGSVGKILGAALVGFVAFGPTLVKSFDSMKKMFDGVKGMFNKGKDFLTKSKKGQDSIQEKMTEATSKETGPKDSKGGLKSLADGLREMGDPKVFAGIGAVALAGPALLLMLPAMPTLFLMGALGLMADTVESGFRAMANGISAMGQAKGLVKGAIAMVLVGASLIPFAFALQMMSDVGWNTVLIAITMMAAGVLALVAIGAIVMGPGGIALLMGALALVAVGVALMAFAASLLIFAPAAERMQGLDFGWLSSLGWNLLAASPGLFLGGLALAFASPALMIGSAALLLFSTAAVAISSVDWSSFAKMGDALLSVVPGLLGFAIAGLMFVNPITMIGMVMMLGTLAGLAKVLTPLSESLSKGSDGLDKFAQGLEKLQKAANNLDLQKLEALKDLSFSMAVASIGGGIFGDQIKKIAEALAQLSNSSSGAGGGSGTKKLEINLKMNGRDIQNIIVDDTSIVS